jgi:hypothetical protein
MARTPLLLRSFPFPWANGSLAAPCADEALYAAFLEQ